VRSIKPVFVAVSLAVLYSSFELAYAAEGDASQFSFDKHTNYSVVEQDDGFTIMMFYTRHRIVPKNKSLIVAAQKNIIKVCNDYATSKKRQIKGINKLSIKMFVQRDMTTGILSWVVKVKARYAGMPKPSPKQRRENKKEKPDKSSKAAKDKKSKSDDAPVERYVFEPDPIGDIYLYVDDQTYGPYTLEFVKEKIASNELSGDYMAWHEGLRDWTPLKDIVK